MTEVRPRGGLVEVAREADHKRDLRQRLGEAGPGWQRERGIRVLHDEDRDFALGHGLGQGDQIRVTAGPGQGRVRSEADRPTHVAEGIVQEPHRRRGVRRSAHGHPARDDQARPALHERLGQVTELGGGHPALSGHRLHVHRAGRRDEGLRLLRREGRHLPRLQHEPQQGERDPRLGARSARDPLVGVGGGHRVARLDVDHARGVPVPESVRAADRAARSPWERSTSRGSRPRARRSSSRPRTRDGESRPRRRPPPVRRAEILVGEGLVGDPGAAADRLQPLVGQAAQAPGLELGHHRDPPGPAWRGGDLLHEELLRVGDGHRAPGGALTEPRTRDAIRIVGPRGVRPGRGRRARRRSRGGRGYPPA